MMEWQGAKVAQSAMQDNKKLPVETITQLRTLAHDLSNYIETIMQASYLLAQTKLDDGNRKWLELIEKASQDAARVNREIREILRSQS
jgi:signal transduction histidine kinase